MKDIKTKEHIKGSIKTLDKARLWTERIKDPIAYLNEKAKDATDDKVDPIDYASDKIKYYTNRAKDESIYASKKAGNIAYKEGKKLAKKSKDKVKQKTEEKISKDIEKFEKIKRNTPKRAEQTKVAMQRAKEFTIKTTKKTVTGVKKLVQATVKTVKAIIEATKSLISAIVAGGSVAIIIIIVICLVGLLCSSIFGIFFSSEKTTANAISMKDVVAEVNTEFYNKLDLIQSTTPHDEYKLVGTMTPWKDVLLVYTAKQSEGNNKNDVITIDNNKKQIIKQIFWDMNEITSEVKQEEVEGSYVNTELSPTKQSKRVLYVYIKNKSVEDMERQYMFNYNQIKQINELNDKKYESLWNGAIYGSHDSGEYVSWRQTDPAWANVRIGNSNGTIGRIGCLVTSISILIQKSGVTTPIKPFNPGTFVTELNKVGGFDSNGNLYYGPISKVVPNFNYVGNVNLRGKTRDEKLKIIKEYLDKGYYLTAEVKGATENSQHWVAVTGVNEGSVSIVDPGSSATDMWSAYEWNKTSQFNYFKAN